MTPSKISKRVVGERIDWIDKMIAEIRSLPLGDYDTYTSDKRNIWTCESCLRRALEALLDLGRHILAKGFGKGVTEYKEIADELENLNVLTPDEGSLLKILAGYRNRLVHFYHEITPDELYEICTSELEDIFTVKNGFLKWFKENPGKLDQTL
jgi:uncharacterized protein YutE (UPF0331/DUF86 family)